MENQTLTLGTLFTGNAENLVAQINRVRNSMAELVTQQRQVATSGRTMGRAIAAGVSGLEKQASGIKQIGKQIGGVEGGIRRLMAAMKVTAAYGLAATALYKFVGALKSGTDEIVNYDQALKNLQAITKATTTQMVVMDEKIRHVARTTKFSTVEVAEGMTLIGQAGFTTTEAVATVQSVANLATGTLTNFKDTADLVTTAIRAFGLQAADSARVTDIFANAVNRSKLDIEKIRTAFSRVGPIAHMAGLSLEETMAAMGGMADQGIRASTISTGLRQVLARLLGPNQKLEKAFQESGIDLDKLVKHSKRFIDVLKGLTPVLYNNKTGLVDMAKAFRLFGKRGAQAAAVLVSLFKSGRYDDLLNQLYDVNSAQEMAAKQAEGLGLKFKNLADRARLAAVAFGEGSGLTNTLRTTLTALQDLMGFIEGSLMRGTGALIARITFLTTAVISLGLAFKALRAVVKVLFKVLVANKWIALVAAVAAVIGVLAHFAGAAKRATEEQIRLTTKIQSASSELSLYANQLESLKSKYDENGKLSRAYESIVVRLAAEHKELGDSVDLLSLSYDELLKKVIALRDAKLEEGLKSAKKGLESAVTLLETQMSRESVFYKHPKETEKLIIDLLNLTVSQYKKLFAQKKANISQAVSYLYGLSSEKNVLKLVSKAVAELRTTYMNLHRAKVEVSGKAVVQYEKDTNAEIKFLQSVARYESDSIKKLRLLREADALQAQKDLEKNLNKAAIKYKGNAEAIAKAQDDIRRKASIISEKRERDYQRKESKIYADMEKERLRQHLKTVESMRKERIAEAKNNIIDKKKEVAAEKKIDIDAYKTRIKLLKDFLHSKYVQEGYTAKQILKLKNDIASEEEKLAIKQKSSLFPSAAERAKAKAAWEKSWKDIKEVRAKQEAEAIKAQEDKEKKAAKKYEEITKEMLRNIQNIWASAFEDLFTGQIKSFGDFFDEILHSFEKMLAQMTAAWVASGLMGLISGKGFSGFTSTDSVVGGLLSKITGAASTASTVSGLAGGPTFGGLVSAAASKVAGWLGIGSQAATGTGIGAAGGVGIGSLSGGSGFSLSSLVPSISGMGLAAGGAGLMAFAAPAIGEFFGSLFNSHGPSGPSPIDIAKSWAGGKSSSTVAGITIKFDPESINTFKTVTDGFRQAVERYGMSERKSEANYAEYDQSVDKFGNIFAQLGPDLERRLINGGILMGNGIKDFMQLASIESGKKLKDDIVNAGYDVSKALKDAISSSTVHYDGPMSIGYSGPRYITTAPSSKDRYEGWHRTLPKVEGGRAFGGPVLPWKTYLVGERGPELLRMGSQSGTVDPSVGPPINLTIPVHIAGERVQHIVAKIVDNHIVERNVRGVDPGRRLF